MGGKSSKGVVQSLDMLGEGFEPQQVDEIWHYFDEDGSGYLEAKEAKKFIKKYCKYKKMKSDAATVESLFKLVDLDGDGRLHKAELMHKCTDEFAASRTSVQKNEEVKKQIELETKRLRQSNFAAKRELAKHTNVSRLMMTSPVVAAEQQPSTWVEQKETCQVYTLSSSSVEYKEIQAEFKRTCNKTITGITRIQNKYLWSSYAAARQTIQIKNCAIDNKVEMKLWHGTRGVAPSVIYQSTRGYDHSCGSTSGMFGPGIYFSERADFCCTNYAHSCGGSIKEIMYAHVVTGDVKHYTGAQRNLTRPPEKTRFSEQKVHEFYDSISAPLRVSSGNFRQGKLFVVYDNLQTYPAYVVKFR